MSLARASGGPGKVPCELGTHRKVGLLQGWSWRLRSGRRKGAGALQQRQRRVQPAHLTLSSEAQSTPTTLMPRPRRPRLSPCGLGATREGRAGGPTRPSPARRLLPVRPALGRAQWPGAGSAAVGASCSRALEHSERPASPRADLGGFLFPSSASVPFISGDGPQERKVTPPGPGSTRNRLLLPRGLPLPPPTKIPSRWFGSRGEGGGGRGTFLRPETLLPGGAPSSREARAASRPAPGAAPTRRRPRE